jgi:hypothetical protein
MGPFRFIARIFRRPGSIFYCNRLASAMFDDSVRRVYAGSQTFVAEFVCRVPKGLRR